MYQLRLYLSGKTERSNKEIEDLTSLLKDKLRGQYTLQIINIIEAPDLAEKDQIVVTPTLVKRSPSPMRRIVGDLSKGEKVLAALGLTSEEE
jgi:circadian clock protein KaiB